MKHASIQGTWIRAVTTSTVPLLLSAIFLAGTLETARAAEPAPTAALPSSPEPTPTAVAPAESSGPGSFLDWFLKTDRLSGDWAGARTKLEDVGLRFSMFYNHFWAYKDNGGLSRETDEDHSGSFDFFGMADFEKMGVIPGGEALIQVKNNWSYSINREVGALGQPIDDADGYLDIYIDQLWYQQSFAARKFQTRIGYLDQQVILDRNAFANSEDKQFMNTYLDNNNAIIPLAIGPGVSLFYNPLDWVSFVLGAADADSRLNHSPFDELFDDWDFYGFFETDFKCKVNSTRGPLPGNYRFGALFDPVDKPVFGEENDIKKETGGFYLSFDQMLWPESEADKQGFGVFARYGWRPDDVNLTEHFWSTGAQYQGLLPTRDDDVLGFAVYSAIRSSKYRHEVNPDADSETGYETYYSVQLTPALAFTPGFQYISQPGALKSRKDAMIFALRARVSF